MSEPSANSIQIGGSHYKNGIAEHWDVCEAYGIGYLESAATKYISRSRKKGTPRLDLLKAQHYTQKLLELHEAPLRRQARGFVPMPIIARFCDAEELTPSEAAAVVILFTWSSSDHLRIALQMLGTMASDAAASEAAASAETASALGPGTPEDGGHHERQRETQ